MAGYPINLSNGTLITSVNPGTFNTSTFNIALLGRGVSNYGEITAENFVHMLEHFAASQPPGVNPNLTGSPTTGQLWYNTTTKQLNVYDIATSPQWRAIPTFGSSFSFVPGNQANPGLFPEGNSNTGFFQPATNNISITTNGIEKFRVNPTGRVALGNGITSSSFVSTSSAPSPALTVQNNAILLTEWSDSSSNGLVFSRSRGNTVGTNVALQTNDQIGEIVWEASSVSNYLQSASIRSVVDANITLTSSPGSLIFSTTNTGSTTPSERMRINSNGEISFGGFNNALSTNANNIFISVGGTVRLQLNNGFSEFFTPPRFVPAPIAPQDLTNKSYVDNNKTLRNFNGSPTVPSYNVTVSTLPPSGGSDGDVWYQYEP